MLPFIFTCHFLVDWFGCNDDRGGVLDLGPVYMEASYSLCWDKSCEITHAPLAKVHPSCRVSQSKCLHGKIFISPGQGPASFHLELAKASYSLAPCKHFTEKPIIF